MTGRRDKQETAPRKRALVSCDRCKLRRARCIRDRLDEPCADCKANGVHCESKLPRKQRVYGSVETLSLRYRALDALVKGLFPEEATQDVDTLFKIAAARNIPMPASDDYTPANIFKSTSQQPKPPQLQLPPEPPQQSEISQSHLQPSPPIPQTLPPLRSLTDSVQSIHTTSASSSTKGHTQHNPFSEVQEPSYNTDALIPTRHGVPHYFGPSSSFRLATTILGLVARCKAVSGTDFPVFRASSLSHFDPTSRSRNSDQPSSTNPSDEEYTVPDPKDNRIIGRRSRKRSRTQMEDVDNRWEHTPGAHTPGTIGGFLPSRSLADALVAAYFDQLHVFLPIFHRSMFQLRLEATYSRKEELVKDCTDIGWLVILALVFAFGCQQLQEHDPKQANKLRMKFLGFAKTHFRQLLITTCLTNVQALILFNLHHHSVGQKSTSWLLIGLAARMAITMGMHRDSANMEFEPIERNTRRQAWWSIYAFERILCSILGRPTVIDDREMATKVPDSQSLEQRGISAEFMEYGSEILRLSYTIRQRAYFDGTTAGERSPTLDVAERLLRECDEFFATIPPHFALNFSPMSPDQRARLILLHIYYLYVRCIVSRDFLVRKVERRICLMENVLPPFSEDWTRTFALSDDCVESAHQSIRCIMAGAHLGIIGNSWLDLFFVFHSVLIVCADFLARPKKQPDSPKDTERKAMVRAMLNHVRGMRELAPTYKILSQIAMQFASITGVADDSITSHAVNTPRDPSTEHGPSKSNEGPGDQAVDVSEVQEDWFENATTNLGIDFFDLTQASGVAIPPQMGPSMYPGGYYLDPNAHKAADWAARGMPAM